MPAGFGVGDHRLFVIDFKTSSLVGSDPPRIVRSGARRLNTDIPGVADRYDSNLEKNIEAHNLIERLQDTHRSPSNKQVVKQ